MSPDPVIWSGLPPCPFCSAKRTLPCENEQDYLHEYSAWMPIIAGLAVFLLFFLVILTAGSILRPFSVILLLAGLAYFIRLRESRRRKRRNPDKFYCEDCRRTFRLEKTCRRK